jgi:uncharacterized protein DUF7009
MERHITVRRYAMKLRIKGNSLRIRVTPSEVKQLLRCREIREHVQFTAISGDRLTYDLLSSSSEATTTVAYRLGNITVSVPENQLKKWAGSNDVGVYAEIALGDNQALSVAIEKDFACLDLSDAENEDTFPNPNFAATC